VPAVPPVQPRTAIIGAGSSGIAAAKALSDRRIDFVCFEASDRVGGNWVFGNRNGMSSAYEGLHINTSRERMEYADYPMPKSIPDFPHHTHIARYFDDYADRFGVRDHIRFSTSVTHARPRAGGGWTLTMDSGETEEFDALLVANGHHWNARWPEPAFDGHDVFEGVQMHAHEYTSDELLRDRDVVVLGMGNSAMDVAVESSYVANTTTLAARRGAWIVPKYLFGRPMDQLPANPRVPFRIQRAIFKRILLTYTGPMERYGLPKPDHDFLDAHPTVSGRILDRLAHGAIVAKPNIARLSEREVHFTDGTSVPADVVVYCTGYKITFPFFDEDLINAPDNRIELFQRVVHPDHDDLFFIGLVQPLGAMMPLAEAQGKWIAEALAGNYRLPPRSEMLRSIAADRQAMDRRYVASKRHTVQVDFAPYLDAIAKELEAGRVRAARGGVAA
jgi:dimethylaniline monooxygenase (N-oxide forming)